jgi:uncharacterized protein (TIGR04141 family)
MATPPLTIFLAKEGVSEQDLLIDAHGATATPIQIGHVKGTLYTKNSPPHPPSWASFFSTAMPPEVLALETASASALLVVPMKNRTFAVTFGYARHLIDLMAVEARFGLHATLNSISQDNVRTIDKKTFEGISTHTREQASKETSIGDFGLDVERDVVSAVTGTPTDSTLGSQMIGKDSLTARCDVTLDGLPELLQAYYAKSKEDTYRDRFSWVDNIFEVRDEVQQKNLDAILVEMLRAGGSPKIWLAIPELIDWSDVKGFSYSKAPSAEIFHDVHLSKYIDHYSAAAISDESLRRHRICGHRRSTDAIFETWPVYQCIHAEIAVDDATYLLNGGHWYQIDNDFVVRVDQTVDMIAETSFAPVDYAHGEHEDQYNKRLSAAIKGSCCLDRNMILHGGGRSRVEFCDIYAPSRHMIHVKRYGSASVLSHLFAQGVVSAVTFMSDGQFREKVNTLLPETLQFATPANRPNASDFEIAFLVASQSTGKLSLPFFSRVTLRNAYRQLTSYGFKTTLTKVQVV